MSNWISVNDGLPKTLGDRVLVLCRKTDAYYKPYGDSVALFGTFGMSFRGDPEWRIEGQSFRYTTNPSHWMPIPELPKEP